MVEQPQILAQLAGHLGWHRFIWEPAQQDNVSTPRRLVSWDHCADATSTVDVVEVHSHAAMRSREQA